MLNFLNKTLSWVSITNLRIVCFVSILAFIFYFIAVLGLYSIPAVNHPNPLLLALLAACTVSPVIGLGTYISLKLRKL